MGQEILGEAKTWVNSEKNMQWMNEWIYSEWIYNEVIEWIYNEWICRERELSTLVKIESLGKYKIKFKER